MVPTRAWSIVAPSMRFDLLGTMRQHPQLIFVDKWGVKVLYVFGEML